MIGLITLCQMQLARSFSRKHTLSLSISSQRRQRREPKISVRKTESIAGAIQMWIPCNQTKRLEKDSPTNTCTYRQSVKRTAEHYGGGFLLIAVNHRKSASLALSMCFRSSKALITPPIYPHHLSLIERNEEREKKKTLHMLTHGSAKMNAQVEEDGWRHHGDGQQEVCTRPH